jgi:phage-related minor tail protein
MRGASDGVRAFFQEMETQSKSAAATMYESLNSALDGVSANLAKMMSGQKSSWAQLFQGIGESMLKDTIKSKFQEGLGALGKHFGLDLGGGHPDGTTANKALWVRFAGMGAAIPGALGAAGKGLGGDIGSLSSLIIKNLIPHATGGTVTPGSSYWVGEHGPEPFVPDQPGTIMSNEAMRGGSGHQVHIGSITVHGGDPEITRTAIAEGIRQGMHSAIGTSVQVQHDMGRRKPAGARV